MLKLSGCPRLTWGRVPTALASSHRCRFLSSAASGCGTGRGVQRRDCATSTTRRVRPGRRPALRPAALRGTGGQSPHPRPPLPALGEDRGRGATRGVTPRQACPRPDSLGRNLRSKTRWFTGFCNSHQVSHFATFFIDARAKISVAESHKKLTVFAGSRRAPPCWAGS